MLSLGAKLVTVIFVSKFYFFTKSALRAILFSTSVVFFLLKLVFVTNKITLGRRLPALLSISATMILIAEISVIFALKLVLLFTTPVTLDILFRISVTFIPKSVFQLNY